MMKLEPNLKKHRAISFIDERLLTLDKVQSAKRNLTVFKERTRVNVDLETETILQSLTA